MAEMFLSVQVDGDTTISVAPLTDRLLEASGQDVEDVSGYFLVERRGSGPSEQVEIMARVLSEDAAFRLAQLFRMR